MPSTEVKPSPAGVPGALTDPAGVTAEDLTFTGASGTQVNGYLARPAGGGSHPGMIVIHEAMGLNEHIRDVSNRIANLGYVTLGVDLYTREGGPPPAGDVQAMMKRLFAMADATVLGDLEGAADFLRAREDVSGRVGCIGFCMGGRYTLLFACASDRLNAAVDCWGGFIDTATPEERSTAERPTPPLELADRLGCPCWARSEQRTRTRHRPWPRPSASARRKAGRRPKSTSMRAPDTPSSPTTGQPTVPAPRPSCGPNSCRSSSGICSYSGPAVK